MPIDPQWISASASILGCTTLGLVVWQVRTNHARDRQEKAVELIKEFEASRDKGTFEYVKLMFALDPHQVRSVYQGQSITICTCLAQQFLPECVCDAEAGEVELNKDCVKKIRETMMGLLNTVERMALAYNYNVADRKMFDVALRHRFIEKGFLEKCITLIANIGENPWPEVKELHALMFRRKS